MFLNREVGHPVILLKHFILCTRLFALLTSRPLNLGQGHGPNNMQEFDLNEFGRGRAGREFCCDGYVGMGRERLLDVSELDPPAPLQEALSALDSLAEGDYLRLLLKRDPVYLYPLLLLQGYEYEKHTVAHDSYEILIWHKGDREAWQAAHAGDSSG